MATICLEQQVYLCTLIQLYTSDILTITTVPGYTVSWISTSADSYMTILLPFFCTLDFHCGFQMSLYSTIQPMIACMVGPSVFSVSEWAYCLYLCGFAACNCSSCRIIVVLWHIIIFHSQLSNSIQPAQPCLCTPASVIYYCFTSISTPYIVTCSSPYHLPSKQ